MGPADHRAHRAAIGRRPADRRLPRPESGGGAVAGHAASGVTTGVTTTPVGAPAPAVPPGRRRGSGGNHEDLDNMINTMTRFAPAPDSARNRAPAEPAPAAPDVGSAYETVAVAIRYLQQHAAEQPELAQVARAVGASEATLQRAFSRFAGVSPKRFLQYLSKEHAQRLLAGAHDVLGAALGAGLSGPGRLHDLLVSCEALTPGEVRRRGAGVTLRHGFGTSPFGRVLAATTPRGLAYLGFVDAGDAAALADLRARWPLAVLQPDDAVAAVIARIAAGLDHAAGGAPLHLALGGTNLQIKVWEALLRLAPGSAVTYTGLATAVGRPDAVRAVASAVGRNPVAVLIPCHRVLREGGALGGYHWGLPRKAALLAREAALRDGGAPPSPAM
jgi:AraC family transcriptional regulator of adaptative response/methylated-DNA-[protein]-cysteine methyltransferase